MKKYQVLIVADAEQDIYEIYRYIAEADSIAKADALLEKIDNLCSSLENFPEKGHIPFELEKLKNPNTERCIISHTVFYIRL